MLARVLLCLRPMAVDRRLSGLLNDSDTLIERVRGQRERLWPQALRRSGDLVIASRGLVPEPAPEHVRALCESPEAPRVILLTEEDDAEDRARLLAAGADEVLSLHCGDDVLREILTGIAERCRAHAATRLTVSRPGTDPRLGDFVSASPSMQTFMEVVHRVVDSDSSILLLGETGVGKERLARAMHADGRRSQGPFVAMNCGALPDTLLESELFGHEQGAFTGASRARRGWFELGHGGTVFLDEIGEMPAHLQVKLLHVLQEREIKPLGSERTIRVDVRVMAATNRDLEADVAIGTFRRDLFYRLNVVTLEVPPLRERLADIPDLVESYIDHYARTIGREVHGIEPEALEALVAHDWPGNVRELMNVLERAVLLCEENEVSLSDLPAVIQALPGTDTDTDRDRAETPSTWLAGSSHGWTRRPLREVRHEVVEQCERTYLTALLTETRGRIGETAERAGIQPRSLFEKMRKLGLRKEDFRR